MTRNRKIEDSIAKFLELQETPSPVSLAAHLATVDADIRMEVEEVCLTALTMQSAFGSHAVVSDGKLIGHRLGVYEIEAFIGEGGMGSVYRARQCDTGRDVALKLIRADRLERASFCRRFDRESRLLERLDHPGIVKALARGEAGNRFFYTMEFVPGRSLRDVINDLAEGRASAPADEAALLPFEDPRSFVRAARLVAELTSAVAHAHGRGVYHRDLKPDNILIGPGGRPRIIDFGLGSEEDSLSSFEADGFPGTRPYAPPQGKRPGTSVERDLWALAVILYEVLTTYRPFRTDPERTLTEALEEGRYDPPERLRPDLPPDLGRVVRKALTVDPADRYPTASAFEQDLNRFLAGEPVLAGRPSPGQRIARHLRRHRTAYVASVLVAVGSLTVFSVARQLEAGRLHSELLDEARRAREGATLEDRLADLSRRRGAVDTLLARPKLAGATVAEAGEVRDRIDADVGEILATTIRDLRLARGSDAGTPLARYRLPSEPDLFRLLNVAVRAKALRGDGVAVDPFDEIFPTLTIEADFPRADEALVTIRPINVLTGATLPAVLTARPPLREVRIPPGFVMIEIGIPGFGHAQYVRDLDRSDRIRLSARILSEVEARSAVPMREIPAGRYRVGQQGGGPTNIFLEREVATAGFSIDQYETTCAEYHEFLRAHENEPLPAGFGDPPLRYDPAWDRLPVRGVTWMSAQRYAEWRGKRLPTWIEWQIAVRGPDAFVFPWGNEPGDIAARATVHRQKNDLPPVGSSPADTSPFGVVDGYGSVREWTCSPYLTYCEGRLFPTGGWRIVQSRPHTYTGNDERSLLSGVLAITPGAPEEQTIGIRCVRSSKPEN